MDDLPPPIKISPTTLNSPNAPDVNGILAPKQQDIFKRTFVWASKIKWTKVTLYFAGLGFFIAMVTSHPAFKNAVNYYFPNSSPLFGRDVSFQGILKSSSTGLYTLVLPDQQAYSLHFKPLTALANLKKAHEVVVKGNFTWEPFVIENAEVYPLNFTTTTSDESVSQITPISSLREASLTNPNPSTPALQGQAPLNPSTPSNSSNSSLPALFSGLKWETTQKRLLIFTSGKRKIEQEGVYLESALVSAFPQDFINYYIEGLKSAGFKETLNSVSPEGIVITYAKDDSFLTFGIKNIYKGSGNQKQLSGYKAFIEHN